MPAPVRIAMWSGPRNISTALMRSWGSRPDTAVCDEPLYARYLAATGLDHPGRDKIIAAGPTGLDEIIRGLTGPVPGGRAIFYQKHMAHHLLPGDDDGWIDGLTNCFLIRDPAEMIASFSKVIADPRPDQLGLPQQASLFDRELRRTGRTPPVIDARDVLTDPRALLTELCRSVGVPFDESMLRWDRGPRPTDGVWAPYWYDSVYKSTGFEPWRPREIDLPASLRPVLDACRPYYDTLAAHRLGA